MAGLVIKADFHQRRALDPTSVPKSYEVKARDRNGALHHGILYVDMIPGTMERVVSFVDVTDKKRAEWQVFRSQKLAALGQLMTGVAHEINNPNNFVFFNIPILREYLEAVQPLLEAAGEEDPDLELLGLPVEDFLRDFNKILDDMELGSTRISEIVRELRTHACRKSEARRQPEDIGEMFQRVMTLTGKQIRKMVSCYRYSVEPELPRAVIDTHRIEQVLINLVINAGHAADKEDSFITMEARRKPGDLGRIQILVEDNGCGIDPDIIDQVYDPFFTTKGPEQGSGLGLWICHRIVEEHDGSISVESSPEVGTTFIVELPLEPPSLEHPPGCAGTGHEVKT